MKEVYLKGCLIWGEVEILAHNYPGDTSPTNSNHTHIMQILVIEMAVAIMLMTGMLCFPMETGQLLPQQRVV